MKIPRSKVKIGAYKYKIVKKKNITYNGKELDGLCDRENQIIYLDSGLKGEKLFLVFIHECLHAIEEAYDIPQLSERVVSRLDHALTAFLIDNKIV